LHPTPEAETFWIVQTLANNFGYTVNSKGFMVLNPKVRCLWGDGIDKDGVEKILSTLEKAGFSAENMVIGMGGGLLQKVNRDTQRFAFKSSAQCRNGQWYDIYKLPKDLSKASKRGKMGLALDDSGKFITMPLHVMPNQGFMDQLNVVFENGELKNEISFAQVRENAKL
jgi:nicotinamide phosphoribosyltransferase